MSLSSPVSSFANDIVIFGTNNSEAAWKTENNNTLAFNFKFYRKKNTIHISSHGNFWCQEIWGSLTHVSEILAEAPTPSKTQLALTGGFEEKPLEEKLWSKDFDDKKIQDYSRLLEWSKE